MPTPTPVDDLVARLGSHHEHPVTGKMVLINPDGPAAADRIEAQAAEIARLREDQARLLKAVGPFIAQHALARLSQPGGEK